jgi:hypothetical protein
MHIKMLKYACNIGQFDLKTFVGAEIASWGSGNPEWLLQFKSVTFYLSRVTDRHTTAWCVLRLRMEEKASRYGGQLRIYWISSRGQPTRGGPPAWGLGRGLTTPHRKKKKRNMLRNVTKGLGRGDEGCIQHFGREAWREETTRKTFGFHKMRGISWLAEHTLSFSRRTLLHGVS